MLLLILNYLSLFLLIAGVILLGGGALFVKARKGRLTPRLKSQLFFWRSLGFWSLVIGGFMIAEKFFPS